MACWDIEWKQEKLAVDGKEEQELMSVTVGAQSRGRRNLERAATFLDLGPGSAGRSLVVED